jgi:hypothetical protein
MRHPKPKKPDTRPDFRKAPRKRGIPEQIADRVTVKIRADRGNVLEPVSGEIWT